MKHILLFTLLLSHFFANAQYGIRHLSVITNLPEAIAQFVPKGFVALDTTYGDLNKDSIPDLILVACSPDEEKFDTVDYKRPLLILIGQQNSQYKLAGRNDDIVLHLHSGGIMGDPFMGIAIKNGYFSAEHYIGYHDTRIASTITFKYSSSNKNWFLYKVIKETNNLTFPDSDDEIIGEDIITETVTSKTFGVVPFEKYSNSKYYDNDYD